MSTPPESLRHRLREQLAELAHEQWSGWMRYMFGRCEKLQSGPWAGCLVIPRELVARWNRQLRTPYADLSEAEQNSDREEADRVLVILESQVAALTAQVPQWQPIETAPKDGTPIRLFAHELIHPDFNLQGSVEGQWQDDEGWIGAVWCSEHDHWSARPVKPTHWMPLPSPPRGEDGTGA